MSDTGRNVRTVLLGEISLFFIAFCRNRYLGAGGSQTMLELWG